MTARRLLLTLDEARAAFAASALKLTASLTCNRERTLKLLGGEGRMTGFNPDQRAAVLEHKQLLNALRADGLEDIVEGELEGLSSYLEMENPERAAAAS